MGIMVVLLRNDISFLLMIIFLLIFVDEGNCQGSFILNKVFYDTDEWVVKDTYLGHHLSGDLLNKPGGLTKYGTDLGRYVYRSDIDGSTGICVKLKENGSWRKITCPGPKAEKLIDGENSKYPTCNDIYKEGITPEPGVNCIHTVHDSANRKPVVNSYREWVIRKEDLDMSGHETNGPICVRLRPDGTTENKVIPCN